MQVMVLVRLVGSVVYGIRVMYGVLYEDLLKCRLQIYIHPRALEMISGPPRGAIIASIVSRIVVHTKHYTDLDSAT